MAPNFLKWLEQLPKTPIAKAIVRISGLIAATLTIASLVTGAGALLANYYSQRAAGIDRAWAVIASAEPKGQVNKGLISALETLVNNKHNLSQIDLRSAFLVGVNLAGGIRP
jgi:hypothetical protein